MTDAPAPGVRAAIETGDVAGLAAMLAADPALADREIVWGANGENRSCPLHYICDLRFNERLDAVAAAALADALIAAGADLDFRQPSGDTPLIAAASLWAPEVGLRLIESGADVRARGLFAATALHWAAMLGLPSLVVALIDAGAEIDLEDARYKATPLGWAVHRRATRMWGARGDPLACARRLRAAGARVEAKWLADAAVKADRDLYTTLTAA